MRKFSVNVYGTISKKDFYSIIDICSSYGAITYDNFSTANSYISFNIFCGGGVNVDYTLKEIVEKLSFCSRINIDCFDEYGDEIFNSS